MVYLNTLGINNAAGANEREIFSNILERAESRSESHELISGRQTSAMRVSAPLVALPEALRAYESRNNRLLWHALEQIRSEVSLSVERFGAHRVAVVLGTSTSGIGESERDFVRTPEGPRSADFHYLRQEIADPSEFARAALGLSGLHYTISTACTSSAKALIEAARLLRADLCDAVVVGGVDTLSSLTLDGFDSLDSVAPELTNPFSVNRRGINIGEGAAVFLMSRDPRGVQLAGYGESSDAYHVSSPDPEGRGAEIALRAALEGAGLEPSQVGYINLHGTGTPKNDFMEAWVTHRIFGTQTPVSSTKPFTGHTLGAAGAQEAALCYMMLKASAPAPLPVHLWDGVHDPELPELNFVRRGDRLARRICMSNSFAFGGNNVSLILRGESE
ncbi:MAG TPA: beta-ketoacyl-[acyl-carrier-protein] synthase family protein [Bdellovibrionota bacterium]|jgi:3-oxoacyl-[acyl-carrier-protein] synthase-1|nr:beta-ketoacyl-[acyl-carrier-protein] synthase family protein [Bdellovibrionota bacterium]